MADNPLSFNVKVFTITSRNHDLSPLGKVHQKCLSLWGTPIKKGHHKWLSQTADKSCASTHLINAPHKNGSQMLLIHACECCSQTLLTNAAHKRSSQTQFTNAAHKRSSQTQLTNADHKRRSQTQLTNAAHKRSSQTQLTNAAHKRSSQMLLIPHKRYSQRPLTNAAPIKCHHIQKCRQK